MGVLIGQNVPTPGLAFLVGAASHFILDLIPHGDSKLYYNYKAGEAVKRSVIYVATDAIICIAVFVYLLEVAPYASRGTIIAGVIGAILPDLLVALGEAFCCRPLYWLQRAHMRIHDVIASRLGNLSFRSGTVMQIIVFIALMLLVRR